MPGRFLRGNPVALVLIAIASAQSGSSVAKLLFGLATPYEVTLLRSAFACLVLLVLAPPRPRGHTTADWVAVVAYGLSLAGMNLMFYLSIERIPIGLAVTLEFLGPLLLALRGAGRLRDYLWVGLAAIGVVLLGAFPSDADIIGMGLAVGAGAFWAAYILLAGQVGRRWPGASGLTAACIVAAVALLLPAPWLGSVALARPAVLGLGLLVALMSTVVPYGLELAARRELSSGTFGILMSLEPAAAALFAWLIVGELLGWQEWVAMGCVVVASVGATRSRIRGRTAG